ncbi:MAG TPA: symmetrical bis(5'-nucleosyl)-tetraphosphatase [Nitrospira sp.]|jgi:bis(5'-nucleosyl)-tetraphosphatase (symmetrical)|nr:symmetrical bis(5'-nucleosyl)-tetraphosphatase [Nitrospira sp.]
MATYAIGDVQGCWTQLAQLIDRLRFNPQSDRLWFVGDLVNRGPNSLAVLRFIRDLGHAVRVVLGNHDLFLLAVSEGVVPLRLKDTIRDVLEADDRQDLLAWLRQQPLHHRERSYLMVHAGLLPQWTADDAARFAEEVEAALSGEDYKTFLQALFHEPVTTWSPALQGATRLATIARVFTRLRTCTAAGETSNFSGPPEEAPSGYLPWFRIPGRRNTDTTIITGHWAALGLHLEPNLLAIDSGCVWGRQLTAIRLEDRAVFQVEYVR